MPITHGARAALALLGMGLALAATEAKAQSIADRVRAIGSGTVELRYTARPGACGDGRLYFSLGSMRMGQFDNGRDGVLSPPCVPGPVRVRLQVADGAVTNVRTFVGPEGTAERMLYTVLAVPSASAAQYLLGLAETGPRPVAHAAMTGAVLADSVSVWRRLLAIARDSTTRPRSTQREALHWVGRFAAAKLEGHGEDIGALRDDDRDDTRASAVFALSQLRNGEGMAPLAQIARTHRDVSVRQKALFWLAQSGDSRAITIAEDILRR